MIYRIYDLMYYKSLRDHNAALSDQGIFILIAVYFLSI